MTTITFPVLRLIGHRPDHLPDGLVLNAPRPLHGTDVSVDLRGLTVVIEPDAYRRAELLERNRRLDATVIEWVAKDDALAEARERLVIAYGDEALDGLNATELLASWRQAFGTTLMEVDAR